jgi:protein-L-isoaspartate(D-aspartate) O-methyltransferase
MLQPYQTNNALLSMNLTHEHQRMIERLRQQGINHPAVLQAMQTIPRHLFIDQAMSSFAYADHALPIGQGQTISQPYIVARMSEALLLQGVPHNVLEIGTGCGYQTAILSQLIRHVYTVERIKSLTDKAQERLENLGLDNINYYYNDGYLGWREHAPYAAIIVTAAPEHIPTALLEQLEIGGCLIIPVGQRGRQELMKITRSRSGYQQNRLDYVSFVPLQSGVVERN